jgi:hypothetical protein
VGAVHAPSAPPPEERRSLRPLLVLIGSLAAAWLAALVLILIELT